MMTLREILTEKQKNKQQYEPMFAQMNLGSNYTFMTSYYAHANLIDKKIVNAYHDFWLFNAMGENDVQFFDDSFKAFLLMNRDNFQKIYDGLLLEYSPIENVFEHSETTIEYLGKETDTATKEGSETSKTSFKGSEKDELTKEGSEKSTFKTPSTGYTDSVENLTSPENDSNYVGLNKQISKTESRNDESENSFTNRKDTNTKTYTNREDETELSFEGRTDTNEKTFTDRKDKTTIERNGNIGVSESSALLKNEIALRLDSAFYPMIFTKFIREVCIA